MCNIQEKLQIINGFSFMLRSLPSLIFRSYNIIISYVMTIGSWLFFLVGTFFSVSDGAINYDIYEIIFNIIAEAFFMTVQEFDGSRRE